MMPFETSSRSWTSALITLLLASSVTMLLASTSGCTYEPDTLESLNCTDGEQAQGRRCVDGYWVFEDAGSDVQAEVCVPEDDTEFCASHDPGCGSITAPDLCGTERSVDCGLCLTDECVDGSHDCDANATCTDTPESFTCECLAGFTGDGVNCVDVDECSDGTAGCGANATCSNAPGTFSCACDAGYAGDGTICADVDECADGTDDCDANATCMNTPGAFVCNCNAGYVVDPVTGACIEATACPPAICGQDASCVGGFCMCDAGYVGDGLTSCVDIDECANGTDNCDANASCVNAIGSFLCSCNAGYTGTGAMCTDIDECANGVDNCAANASCTNTPGAFTCSCDTGYAGDGVSCADIDECATGTDDCDGNPAVCTNASGSFACSCPAGYTGDGVDPAAGGAGCNDVDECAGGTDNCDPNATCSNNAGGFACACNAGYTGNGVSCTDVDECATGTDNCDANASCSNTTGSFTCACNPGFVGNGVSCTASDLVTSVQTFDVVLSGQTVTAPLPTNSVNAASSVPFVSKQQASSITGSPSDYQIDVFLSADDEVTVTRAAAGAAGITVKISVVEFNPVMARVQTGTFAIADGVLSGIEAPTTPVATTATFPIFYYANDTASDQKGDNAVTATITGASELTFERLKTQGNVSGHWWLVESLTGDFAVQAPASVVDVTGVTADATISPVDLTKTFLIYSTRTSASQAGANVGHVSCNFTDSTTVNCQRESPTASVEVQAYVVSLFGPQKVQHTEHLLAAGTNLRSRTVSLPSQLGFAVPWLGQTGMVGACQSDSNTGAGNSDAFATVRLSPTGSVVADRQTSTGTMRATVDLIEWR